MAWSDKWLLKFNPEKCKFLHIGHGFQTEYGMIDNGINCKLHITGEEKDLGIYITDDLKPGLQCAKAASKAMSVLGVGTYQENSWEG